MSDERHDSPAVPPPPRMKGGDLPDVADDPPFESWKEVTEDSDRQAEDPPDYTIMGDNGELSQLAPAALFELNQAALDDSVPNRPLVAPLVPMAALREEYENGNEIFVKQIDWLVEQGYIGIRRTRGDGDCFYRSLAYAYVERILNSTDQGLDAVQAVSMLESTQSMLETVGFQPLVFEDFLETFTTLIKRVTDPEPGATLLTHHGLLEAFNNPEISNSIVVYLRLLTSAQIRLDPDAYAPFLFHPELGEPMDTRDFCENFVEAVGKEADHVQMTALTRALRINILVAYLDGRVHSRESSAASSGKGKGRATDTVEVEFVPFENGEEGLEPIRLLYRPGHYDILEQRSEDPDVEFDAGIELALRTLP
ncbi:hypothetical protein NM688_g1448 [Phlebia brevispora]|uniref:Uncharacterized protein n=1 Tax=Phlebia brevispora TaxID=194682 RepID=A0ACC1TBI2_9APHY|nr:hypothetical protein NM688_g1448 [Phlebia brevispora]